LTKLYRDNYLDSRSSGRITVMRDAHLYRHFRTDFLVAGDGSRTTANGPTRATSENIPAAPALADLEFQTFVAARSPFILHLAGVGKKTRRMMFAHWFRQLAQLLQESSAKVKRIGTEEYSRTYQLRRKARWVVRTNEGRDVRNVGVQGVAAAMQSLLGRTTKRTSPLFMPTGPMPEPMRTAFLWQESSDHFRRISAAQALGSAAFFDFLEILEGLHDDVRNGINFYGTSIAVGLLNSAVDLPRKCRAHDVPTSDRMTELYRRLNVTSYVTSHLRAERDGIPAANAVSPGDNASTCHGLQVLRSFLEYFLMHLPVGRVCVFGLTKKTIKGFAQTESKSNGGVPHDRRNSYTSRNSNTSKWDSFVESAAGGPPEEWNLDPAMKHFLLRESARARYHAGAHYDVGAH
jgi:hypothetical protein